MAHHIFQLETELQNIPEAAPKASPSFSVSEKLARYGSSALSGAEHLTLLVGKEAVALTLIRHFGSLKALARASYRELRQFLPRRKAEAVIAALSMSAIAETEHARSEQLDNPESIYRASWFLKGSTVTAIKTTFLIDICLFSRVNVRSTVLPRTTSHALQTTPGIGIAIRD